jgi:hypothetical protein
MRSTLNIKLKEEIKKLNLSEKDEEEIQAFVKFLKSYKSKKARGDK